jgi:hypothetical protein
MTYVVMDEVRKGRLKAHFDFRIIEGTPGKIIWEGGRLFYRNEFEAMYYHLIKFKEHGRYPKLFPDKMQRMSFTKNKLSIS